MNKRNLTSIVFIVTMLFSGLMFSVTAQKCEASGILNNSNTESVNTLSSGIPGVDPVLYDQGMAFVQLVKSKRLLDPGLISQTITIQEALGESDYKVYETFVNAYNALGDVVENVNTQVFLNSIVIAYNSRLNQGTFLYIEVLTDLYSDMFRGLDASKIPSIAAIYGNNADQIISLLENGTIDDVRVYLNADEISTKLAPYEVFLDDLYSRF